MLRAPCCSTCIPADWDEELLQLLDIPREMLPEVRVLERNLWRTAPACLARGVRIGGIAGDQQAALVRPELL